MVVVRERIMRFATLHNRLPFSLAETEPITGKVDSLNDAWRHPLLYSYDTNEVVTLRSLGEDDRVGGSGEDRDMTGIFAARGATGQWAGESWEWVKDPLEDFRTTK